MSPAKVAAIAFAMLAACAALAPIARAQPAATAAAPVVFEVDKADIRKSVLDLLRDKVRTTLREANIGWASPPVVHGDAVEVTLRADAKLDTALGKLRDLSPDADVTDASSGLVRVSPSEVAIIEREQDAVAQSIAIIKRRLGGLGVADATVEPQGEGRIAVAAPGLSDPSRLAALLTPPGKLEFRLVDLSMTPQAALSKRPPEDSEVLYEKKAGQRIPLLVGKYVFVDGASMVDVQPSFDVRTKQPVVLFRFNATGTRRLARATQENVGRPFAIVLDNEVISAPVIREPITGGSGMISGDFTVESANNLAITLRSGTLPAQLKLVEPAPPSSAR